MDAPDLVPLTRHRAGSAARHLIGGLGLVPVVLLTLTGCMNSDGDVATSSSVSETMPTQTPLASAELPEVGQIDVSVATTEQDVGMLGLVPVAELANLDGCLALRDEGAGEGGMPLVVSTDSYSVGDNGALTNLRTGDSIRIGDVASFGGGQVSDPQAYGAEIPPACAGFENYFLI